MKNIFILLSIFVLFFTTLNATNGKRAKKFNQKKEHMLENITKVISFNQELKNCIQKSSKNKEITACKKVFRLQKKRLKIAQKEYRAKQKKSK
jgi:hypothetical protein